MLAYVPVRFDLYRAIRPHLRWTLQCLVAFADKTGRCFPSVRKLAEVTELSKSTVSRHLAELTRGGQISRTRKPGGVYTYQIDSRFLPAAREVSHSRDRGVPRAPTEEKTSKKKEAGAYDWEGVSGQWRARVRSWQKSRFWLANWGPRPDQLGCFAPAAMLQTITA